MKTKLYSALLINIIAFTGLVNAQQAKQEVKTEIKPDNKPSSASETVVVQGNKKERDLEQEAKRLLAAMPGGDPNSASSCGFMGTYSPFNDVRVLGYLASFQGVDGVENSLNNEADFLGENIRFVNTSSPFGDASRPRSLNLPNDVTSESTTAGGTPGACGLSDELYAAGRAYIEANDKSYDLAMAAMNSKNYPEALKFFKKSYATVSSKPQAGLMVAKMYWGGIGTEENKLEAIKWFEKVATERVPLEMRVSYNPKKPNAAFPIAEAAVFLGELYLKGDAAIPKDINKSLKWYKLANELGHAPSSNVLGRMYQYGIGVPVDQSLSMKYYKAAAELGFTPAQISLARIYQLGRNGNEKDMKYAIAWYSEAAKKSDMVALNALAEIYDSGMGTQKDTKMALSFYKEAAIAGNPKAQYAIGTYFYSGEADVPKNQQIARKWFEHAAIAGQSNAMFDLGAMLINGEGGDKDKVKAYSWIYLASIIGNEDAKEILPKIEKMLSKEELDKAKSILKI